MCCACRASCAPRYDASRTGADTELFRTIHVLTPPDVQHKWGAKHMRIAPVKQLAAAEHLPALTVPADGLEVFELPSAMQSSNAPLLVTASFGHRIPTRLLAKFSSPSLTLNLHPSLLPALRGAAPIQWAIARQLETGVTVQQLHSERFDTGGILAQEHVSLPSRASYPEAAPVLAAHGAALLTRVIADLPLYAAHVQAQDDTQATRAPKLAPRFSNVRFDHWDAATLDARLRAFGYAVRFAGTLTTVAAALCNARAVIYTLPTSYVLFPRGLHTGQLPRRA